MWAQLDRPVYRPAVCEGAVSLMAALCKHQALAVYVRDACTVLKPMDGCRRWCLCERCCRTALLL